MRKPTQLLVGFIVAVLSLTAIPSANAQYFGRNKVQWEHFDFKILHTPHFDIYYYDKEADVVNDVGRQAERWYTRLSRVFGHTFEHKPIVLYANPADFQQTTTTSELLGEGTGGFTDPYQNRVVLPLTGDYAENDHVLGHELVHVFQFDIAHRIAGGNGGSRRRFNLDQMPLWMVEGMAEYFSKGRVDPLTAMWMRDATNRNRLPDLNKLTRDPRYFPYRYGQAFLAYIGGRYGDDDVVRLFLAAGLGGVEQAFPRVFGISAKQVFQDWHAAAREMYEPIFLRRPSVLGTPLLGKKTTRGDLNIAPAISPDGKWLAFLSSRDLFTIDLYLADATTGQIQRRLVSSEGDPHFDALRFVDSAGSWSPDSKRFVLATFEKGDNFLGIIDIDSRRVETIKVPGVDALTNPAWSPDGKTIAFSGQSTGVTDLFLYDLDSKAVRRLTNDKYADLQPAWSPDGRTLAFVTDRGPATNLPNLAYGELGIATIDVATGTISPVNLFQNGKHINPQYGPDGSLYFIANPDGIPDLYRYTFATGGISRITHVATGVSGITDISPAMSIAPRTGQIAVSIYEEDDYNIYTLPATTAGESVTASLGDPLPRAALLPPVKAGSPNNYTTYLQRPTEGLPPESTSYRSGGTDRALHVTYVGPPTLGIGADRFGYGAGGTVSAYFSDVLGENNVGFTVQGGGSSQIGFAESFSADVFYLNQRNRINWGAEVSHIPYVSASTFESLQTVNVQGQQVLADVLSQQRDITTFDDVTALTQYPLGLTRRIELNGGFEKITFKSELEQQIFINGQLFDDTTQRLGSSASLNLVRGTAAFVGDSSIFGFISPIRGTRYRYEVQALTGDLKFETLLADYRKYFFIRPVTVAFRGLHYGRYGTDSQSLQLSPLFLGDPGLVRGYDFGSFSSNECTGAANTCPAFDRLLGSRIALASAEVRIPLFGTKEYGLINAPFLPTELYGFADAGAAWNAGQTPQVKFVRNTNDREAVASAGVGVRILLSYIPIEFYYAKPFQRPEKGAVFGFNIAPGW